MQTAWGSPLLPGDDAPVELLKIGTGLKAPVRALCMWIEYFGRMKAAKGYAIESPRLFVAAAPRGLPPWIRANRTLVDAASRAQQRELARDVAELFYQIPAWQKLLPGGPEISPDVSEHVDGAIAIVQALRGRPVTRFALHVIVRLQDHQPLAKAPGRFPNAPPGPRLLALLFELAEEFVKGRLKAGGVAAEQARVNLEREELYNSYCLERVEEHLAALPAEERNARVAAADTAARRKWAHMPSATILDLARKQLVSEVTAELKLPTIEDFFEVEESDRPRGASGD